MLHLWLKFGWKPSKHVEDVTKMLTPFKDSKNNSGKKWLLCVFPAKVGEGDTKITNLQVKMFLSMQVNLQGESGLLFTPVLTLWSGCHIAGHVCRWVIVPSDLAQSFGVVCANNHYHVVYREITNMRRLLTWFSPQRKGNSG